MFKHFKHKESDLLFDVIDADANDPDSCHLLAATTLGLPDEEQVPHLVGQMKNLLQRFGTTFPDEAWEEVAEFYLGVARTRVGGSGQG